MPVKILRVDERIINPFLETPGIRIIARSVIPVEIPEIAFFYETAESDQILKEQMLKDQTSQLENLIILAKQVSKDEGFAALKNASQRQIYLLKKYNLPSSDASTVSELLKPEMVSILGGAP
ncbi:MAG: hypothetical protein M0Q91_05470 [Methanoregula sp.]|jgi:hypothetical protein|nr:hypothetical protein [Methanoregula sp.]